MAKSIIGLIRRILSRSADLPWSSVGLAGRILSPRFHSSAAAVAGTLFGLIVLVSFEPIAARQASDPKNETGLTGVTTDETNSPDSVSLVAQPIDISFDDLKFEIEKGADYKPSMLTTAIKELDGKQIRLRGYVKPGFKQSGIVNFVLVRDNQECCFGPGAALYDCVMVKMAEGHAIDFTVRPISLVGTLYFKEFIGKDKKVWAIFRMKDARQD